MAFFGVLFWLIICIILYKKDIHAANKQQRIYHGNKRNGHNYDLYKVITAGITDKLIEKGYGPPYNFPCPVTWLIVDQISSDRRYNEYVRGWDENLKTHKYKTVGDRKMRPVEIDAFQDRVQLFIDRECGHHKIEDYVAAQANLALLRQGYLPENWRKSYMTAEEERKYDPYKYYQN